MTGSPVGAWASRGGTVPVCGICGVFNYGTGRPADSVLVRSMTDSMIHRGPDDSGVLIDGSLGLGVRRLSIIDLEGGRQPISNEDRTVHIVMNGEIYNFRELRAELESIGHVFRTRCDSEVPLHAYEEWGLEALPRLNGIFGLAIWDSRWRKLVLARDPFGVKPLYYRDSGNELSFGSELRAILEDPSIVREVDPTGLELFLTFRFVPSPWTALRGIRQVTPGHAVVVEQDGARMVRFYRAGVKELSGCSPDELVEELSLKIRAAVDRQRVADVPVGVLLSGGVDSTAVVSVMRHVTGIPPKTFTVGFSGGFEKDERAAARETATRLGCEHFEIELRSQEYASLLRKCMEQLEVPIATSSALPLMQVCRLAREHVKVVLTGQGADEPFAGYPRHLGERWGAAFRAIPLPVRNALIGPLVTALPRVERLKRAYRSLGSESVADRLREVYSIFSQEGLQRVLGRRPIAHAAAAEAVETWQRDVADWDGLAQMLYVDARFSLPDNLLLYTDKMSMAASLEARVPFLDLELMRFAERIPSHLKLRRGTHKWILKRALEQWVPRDVMQRPKIAFETPISDWLRSGQLAELEHQVMARNGACTELLDAAEVRRLFAEHRRGRRDHHWKLFTLITFELWHEGIQRRKEDAASTSRGNSSRVLDRRISTS